MFDLSIAKILILAVIGLVVFGPEQLPKMAAQAGQALRNLRRLADNAKADLTESLGPEFHDFDFNDLNPKAFVRKHLLDPVDEEPTAGRQARRRPMRCPSPSPSPCSRLARFPRTTQRRPDAQSGARPGSVLAAGRPGSLTGGRVIARS